jgi:hypothetical protein
MAIYRFRITFEDNDEVYRDIDIRSSQTFYDFHTTILSSIGFEDNSEASFFISDDMWRRGDEVALNPPPTEEKNRPNKKNKIEPPKYTMKKCKMAALIDDPHQKFIYVHDPNNIWTFMIELMKIVPDDVKINYPICSKVVGIAPKKLKTPIIPPDILEDLELDELEDHHETEAYAHATEELGVEDLDEVGITEENEAEEDVLEDSDEDLDSSFDDGEESLLDED